MLCSASLPIAYWLALPVPSQQSPLKRLAIQVLQIGPHAAGVESVFSDMGATKTKSRPRMNTNTLKMCTQVRMHLTSEATNLRPSTSSKKSRTQKESNEDTDLTVSNFDSTDDLEYFEEGVFADMDPIDPSLYIDETGFITTLFDFRVFEKSVSTEPSTPPVVISIPDNLGATWSADDLFK